MVISYRSLHPGHSDELTAVITMLLLLQQCNISIHFHIISVGPVFGLVYCQLVMSK